MNRYY